MRNVLSFIFLAMLLLGCSSVGGEAELHVVGVADCGEDDLCLEVRLANRGNRTSTDVTTEVVWVGDGLVVVGTASKTVKGIASGTKRAIRVSSSAEAPPRYYDLHIRYGDSGIRIRNRSIPQK